MCSAPARTLKFKSDNEVQRELRGRVDRYFESTGLDRRDCPRMYLKTAVVLGWTAAFYILLVFFTSHWWLAVPLAIGLGLALAGVGFNVQHDGGHGAYSKRAWVNRLMARSLDLLGGSSYIWARKHNSIHHSYANVTGHDGDIDLGIVGRLSPHQSRLTFHRYQHFYLWVLYGLLPIKWQLYDDFHDVIVGRVAGHPLTRPRGWDLVTFIGGKLIFFLLAFAIPLWLHPVWVVVLVYLVVSFVQGLTLSIVFQLAHCVEEAAFPLPLEGTNRMEQAWAVHQLATAVDYGRGNRLLSWFVGGLNFQIEHHLFPDICHIHYAALSQVVEELCVELGLPYAAHETITSAVVSHYRWLRRLGVAD
ncbi:linoleoyl-CoA desaturase [Planctomycetaceae bacterium SCGC AG-212-D15]|nr:linoleoyl-CoA desaturase [Planctomycetaceae bacterium SCGC AG-212-D15]